MTSPSTIGNLVPIVRWLPKYRRTDFRPDFLAGLAVASVAIPTALGYATVAGVPVQVGLYALPAALLVYAIFASSRQVSMGPTSTVAIMSGAVVAKIMDGSTDVTRAIALTCAVAIAAGVVLMIAGLVRTGWITDLISRPVITGFTIGLSILVIVSELPHLLGVHPTSNDVFPKLTSTLEQVPDAYLPTVGVGILALAVVFVGPRIQPRVPWALLLMVAGIVGSEWLTSDMGRMETLGNIPAGLPTLGIPAVSPSDLSQIILGGASVALAGIGEGLAAGRVFATKGGYRLDSDQELLGTGLANIASGFSGGMPVSGSLSRTAAAAMSGARTQITGVVAACCVLLVLLWLTGPLGGVPRVVLSAIVIASVWPLLDWRGLLRYRQVRKTDFVAALTALFGVLLLGPLNGLLAAIGISILGITLRSSQVTVDALGKIPGEKAGWGAVDAHPDRAMKESVLVARVNAPLFWANATRAADLVLSLVDEYPETKVLVLDLEATSQMDTTAMDSLMWLLERLRARGIDMYIAHLAYRARRVLEDTPFERELGEGHMWHSISQAVRAGRDAHDLR